MKKPLIIKACCLLFDGEKTQQEVADILEVTQPTVQNWKDTDVWRQTEQKLIEMQIQKQIKETFLCS